MMRGPRVKRTAARLSSSRRVQVTAMARQEHHELVSPPGGSNHTHMRSVRRHLTWRVRWPTFRARRGSCIHFLGDNPFGFSSQNLGSLYKGLVKDTFKTFKHLRRTKHTHHPVDDAKGNAEALLAMREAGLKISWD